MLKEKLVFATIAVSVLFACDYTHAKFGDFTKSIISKVKNSRTARAISSDANSVKNAALQGASNVSNQVYGDLKNAGTAAGQNISNQYNQGINTLTNTVSGVQSQSAVVTDSVQAVNNAYAAAAAAKGLYEAKKQTNSSPADIYNAAVDYANKAKVYEETVVNAEASAQESFTRIAQEYQSASANLNYIKSLRSGATNFQTEADKALQQSQTVASALPASVQLPQTTGVPAVSVAS